MPPRPKEAGGSSLVHHSRGPDAAQPSEDAIALILNQIRALEASRQLGASGLGMARTFQRLSLRQDPARSSGAGAPPGDDRGAGMDVRTVRQNKRNAQEGMRYLRVVLRMLDEVAGLLACALELTGQAEEGDVGADLDAEFQNVITAIHGIGLKSEFNGAKLVGPRTVEIRVEGFPTVDVTIGTLDGVFRMTKATLVRATATGARAEVAAAIDVVRGTRASLDASLQQVASVIDVLGTHVENLSAVRSRERDDHLMEESVNLVKFQLLNLAGISALSQTRPASREVMDLLQRFQVGAPVPMS